MRKQIFPALLIAFVAFGSAQAPQSNQAESGAILFRDNCARCHGSNREGTKKGPVLAGIGKKKHWTDEKITNRILNGEGKMPSFRDSLSSEQIQQLVTFLRAENHPPAPPAPQQ